MKAICIRGKQNTVEYREWSKWMGNVSTLINRHIEIVEDDHPLAYNETASVSVLTAAAALAGFVALAEFSTKKSLAKNLAPNLNGRADLWVVSDRRSWAFEFKQFNCKGPPRHPGRLHRKMNEAIWSAERVSATEADTRVAGLICPLYWIGDAALAAKSEVRVRHFINEESDFAWAIEHPAKGAPTFIMFKLI